MLGQVALNIRSRFEEQILVVIDKSTHEEHLSQPSETNNKQFEIAVTFLTGYNGNLNIRKSNTNFYFLKSITDEDGYIQITIPKCPYDY